jgi:hypothetical protein
MHVIEVRNAELIESITKQAAQQGITQAAIGAIDSHLYKVHINTSFARAYLIPSEHHVALPAHEQIASEQIPDEGPPGRRRINATRVAPPDLLA